MRDERRKQGKPNCSSKCKECQDNQPDLCIECKAEFFLRKDICVVECPSYLFVNPTTRKCLSDSCNPGYADYQERWRCLACSFECEKCTGPYGTQCSECFPGFWKTIDGCQQEYKTLFSWSSLYSDGPVGEVKEETQDSSSLANVNPILSPDYSPNQLAVSVLIKSPSLSFASQDVSQMDFVIKGVTRNQTQITKDNILKLTPL